MKKILIYIISLFLIIGCKSHYSYSSSPKKEIKRVKTDIQDLRVENLIGVSVHNHTYIWDFKKYLKEELQKRTYIKLNSKSSNKLLIKASISPIRTKKYHNKVFKVDQFHLKKSIKMSAKYYIRNQKGKVIAFEPLSMVSTENSTISNRSYRDAERKYYREEKEDELYQKLMRSLAKSVVGDIVNR